MVSQLALSAVITIAGYSAPSPWRSNMICLSWRLITSSERMVYTQPWSPRYTKLKRLRVGRAALDFCSSCCLAVAPGAISPTMKARPVANAAATNTGSISR